MSPEEYRIRQAKRRKRIQQWRAAIQNFDFSAHKFVYTDTYADIRPHLQPNVKGMFESKLGAIYKFHLLAERPSRADDRSILLDEVARIEKEWGLV